MQINLTILGQSISFIFFVIFCMKYIWPKIISAIEARQKKITEGIALFEKAKVDLDNAHKQGDFYIKQAKEYSQKIIDKANKNKLKILEKAKLEAEIERKKIINQAISETKIEQNSIYKKIHNDIVDLIIFTSEKIIEQNIDMSTHKNFINKIINNL